MPDFRGPRRLAVIQEPKPALSGSDVAAPYTMMARAFEKMGEAAGAVGGAISQYEKSQQNAILAETLPQLENKITEARLEHRNDPDMVQKTTTEIVRQTADKMRMPALQQAVRAAGFREAGQAYRQTLVEADNRAQQNEEIGFKSELGRLNNRAVALARQGGTDTEEYKALTTDINTIYGELQKNPRFKFPPERAAAEQQALFDEHKGEAIIGAASRLFNKATPTAKMDAQKFLREAAWNPNLNLSPEKRQQIVTRGMAALEGLTAEGKVLVSESKKLTESFLKGVKDGAPVTETQWNDHLGRTLQAGDVDGYYDLQAARWSSSWRAGISTGDLARINQVARDIRSTPTAGATSPNAVVRVSPNQIADQTASPTQRAFLSALYQGESGGRYDLIYGGKKFQDFTDHPRVGVPIRGGPNAGRTSSAAGAPQFLGSTWDEAKTALGLKDFSPANQDKAAIWLAQRDYSRVTGGRNLWNDLDAAKGDPQALSAVASKLHRTWTSLPGGIEPNSATAGFGARLASAISGAGQAARTPPNVSPEAAGPPPDATAPAREAPQMPMTAQQMTFERWKQDALNDARNAAIKALPETTKAISDNLGKGRDIDPTTLDNWTQSVLLAGADGEAAKYVKQLDEAFAVRDLARQAESLPADQRLAFRNKLQIEASKSGASSAQRVFDRLAQDLEQDAKDMREHPYSTYGRMTQTPPAPLLFNSPQQFEAGVKQRSQVQDMIQQRGNTGPMSVFDDDAEKALFRGQVAQGQPGTATAMFKPLFGLDNGKLFATLDDKIMKETLQGMATSRDPAKLREGIAIIDGLYQKDPVETARLIGDKGMDNVRTWQRQLDWMNDEEIAKRIQRINDPQSEGVAKLVQGRADKIVGKLSAADIVAKFDDTLIPESIPFIGQTDPKAPATADARNRLVGDYQTVFREFYANFDGDETKAHEATVEKLRTKYQKSGPDGRIMLHAPEKYYPKINGDHAWFDRMLTEDLERQLGPRYSAVRPSGRNDPGGGVLGNNWDYVLVPDMQTEREVAARTPPTYNVLVRRANDLTWGDVQDRRMPNAGQWEVGTDESGRPMRWPQPGRVAGILQGASIARDQAQSRMWEGWKWMNANPEDRSGPGFSPF